MSSLTVKTGMRILTASQQADAQLARRLGIKTFRYAQPELSPLFDAIKWNREVPALLQPALHFPTVRLPKALLPKQPLPTMPIDTFSVAAVAAALIQHINGLGSGDTNPGQVHLLENLFTKRRGHAYFVELNWRELGKPGPITPYSNGPLDFYNLVRHFPTYVQPLQHLDDRFQPQSLMLQWLTDTPSPIDSPLNPIFGTDPSLIKFHQLGDYSIIATGDYFEATVLDGRYLVQSNVFATTPYHVFDGLLRWFKFTDLQLNRVAGAAIGAGHHSLPDADDLNPIGGAAVYALMLDAYAKTRQAGLDINAMTQRELDAWLKKAAPELYALRSWMKTFDQGSWSLTEERRKSGVDIAVIE